MTEEGITAARTKVVADANRAAGVLAGFLTTANKNASIARSRAAKLREAANVESREDLRLSIEASRRVVMDQAVALGPGPLSARWDEFELLERVPGVLDAAEYVRCGSLRLRQGGASAVEAPLILPLLDHGNIVIEASSDKQQAVSGAVQEILLRGLLGTGAGQLSLSSFDPNLSTTIAMFTSLRQVNEELVHLSLAAPEDLRELMERLSQDVRRISDMFGGTPTRLGEFRRSTGQPIEHYQLVTILNYPTGFDHRLNTLLLTLLRTAPTCGISFVIHYDTTASVPDGVVPTQIHELATTLDLNRSSLSGVDGYQARVGTAPSMAVVEPALENLKARARQAAAPQIDFLSLQFSTANYWSETTADRVTAVIGRMGHQPIEITLGDELEQKHNILVTGAVGQGKSNLLMTLIHSWATRYPPEELELYLLDFRDGVSLFPLASHGDNSDWLPHARVLGLESDRPFGLAVLDHLVGEFERRSKIIKPFGDNIARYRKKQPDSIMPRIIAVIDEFQVLFEEDDDTTRAALLNLERLARRGRGYGIHLVLASQTLSGITAMLAKQDGIFGQFPIRLALYNSAAESRAVLSQNNTEAARLRYRGELVVNKDFGEVSGNQRGVVAYADPAKLARVRAAMVKKDGAAHVPTVFNGSQPARLIEQLNARSDNLEPHAYLGVSIDVDSQPITVDFASNSGRHLTILGTGKKADDGSGNPAAASLQAAVVSLAWWHRQENRPASFIIINLLAERDADQSTVSDLAGFVGDLKHRVRVVSGSEVSQELARLEAEVATRRAAPNDEKVYVVAYGMDRLPQARVLNFTTGTTPVDGLLAVWKEGAQLGVHLLGWWANVRAYNDQVGLDAQGMIDTTMVFRISTDAILEIFGPFVSWTSPDNRALVRDVAQDNVPSTVVPFGAVDSKDLSQLLRDREVQP